MSVDLDKLATVLEGVGAKYGWDARPTLFVFDVDRDTEKPTITQMIVLAGDGKSYEQIAELARLQGAFEADGIALMDEGWTYPKNVIDLVREAVSVLPVEERLEASRQVFATISPPSAYPDRREVRFVSILLSSGETVMGIRIRDEELEVHEGGVEGNAIDVLSSVLARRT